MRTPNSPWVALERSSDVSTGLAFLKGAFVILTGSGDAFCAGLDLSGSTQFGTNSGVNQLTQDGYTSGRLSSYTVSDDGVILGRYTNGQTKPLAQHLIRVLAERRRSQASCSRRLAQEEGDARDFDMAAGGVLKAQPHAQVLDLRIGEHLGHVLDGIRRDSGGRFRRAGHPRAERSRTARAAGCRRKRRRQTRRLRRATTALCRGAVV